MHATVSHLQYSTGYPSFLSYAHQHHHLNASMNVNSSHLLICDDYNTGLNASHASNNIKQLPSDDEDDHRSISSPSDGDLINTTLIPFKKRSRTVPPDEKDPIYFEKRARNNESAKRSRDSRRIKEQQIQDRVNFLEHENFRLSMENQAMRYQLSQLHMLCDRGTKP